MTSQSIIDPPELLRLRQAAKLSQRALGRLAGTSGNTIARLEAGLATVLTLAQLAGLAEALGTTPRNLLATGSRSDMPPTGDDAKVAAALAESATLVSADELAYGLGWDPAHARRAIVHLRRRLAGSGLSVRRSPNGFTLIADADALTHSERRRLERARIKRRCLRAHEAALLRAIATGRITTAWERRAHTNDRVALSALLKAGYAHRQGGRYALTEAVVRTWGENPDRLQLRDRPDSKRSAAPTSSAR